MNNETGINFAPCRRSLATNSGGLTVVQVQSFLSYLILLVSISPYQQFISKWIIIALAGSWLLLTAAVDFGGLYYSFIGTNGKHMIIYLWVLYRALVSLLGHAQFATETLMLVFCLQMFWYYSDKVKILKRQVMLMLAYYALITINSIVKLSQNSQISRLLAGASYEHAGLFMAGYMTIYSAVFILAAGILFWLTTPQLSRTNRLMILFCIVLGTLMLVLAQYTIALLLYALLCLLLFLIYAPTTVRAKTIVSVVLILIATYYFLLPIFEDLLVMSSSSRLKMLFYRLDQVTSYLLAPGNNTDSLGVRPTLYGNSLSTFLANPLWGIGSHIKNSLIVGEHSEIFDLLARFGLVGFICYATSFGGHAKKILGRVKNASGLWLIYIVYILFLMLDPGLRWTDGVALFYLIPSVFILRDERVQHALCLADQSA